MSWMELPWSKSLGLEFLVFRCQDKGLGRFMEVLDFGAFSSNPTCLRLTQRKVPM